MTGKVESLDDGTYLPPIKFANTGALAILEFGVVLSFILK
jgi:hypothetical protein